MKYLIIVPDGLADHPIERLGGKTPVMVAQVPNMDALAAEGVNGLFATVPEGISPGSEVANMSIMGYDPRTYFCHRGPLEAASRGLTLDRGEIALRCNLIQAANGRIESHSGGDLSEEDAEAAIDALNRELATANIRFHQGVAYRHLLILKNGSDKLECFGPHNYPGEELSKLAIRPSSEAGEEVDEAARTADLLNRLVRDSEAVLAEVPFVKRLAETSERRPTHVWPWAPGKRPAFPTLEERTGLRGAAISAVDLIKGLSIFAGMDFISVPGATGNAHTNYQGKMRAALDALEDHDYVYLHIEAPDEAGHDGDLDLKIRVLEDIDRKVVGPIRRALEPNRDDVRIALLPDHPTPVELRIHVREAIPVAIWGAGIEPDLVERFDEERARAGALPLLESETFSRYFLGL